MSYCAISGVDGLVGLSSLCINKLSIDEQLVRDFYGHVVDVFLHLRNSTANMTMIILAYLGQSVTNINQ